MDPQHILLVKFEFNSTIGTKCSISLETPSLTHKNGTGTWFLFSRSIVHAGFLLYVFQ
jgi:hypothetical protein